MSENEQSWSYSDAHRNLHCGRLLVCAMVATRPTAQWPMDSYAFARAVDVLTGEGNIVAKRIRTYSGSAGRQCHDFNEMLSWALHACLIEYLAPSFTRMVLALSPRDLSSLAKDYSAEEMKAARALAHEYWMQVHE